MKRAVVGDVGQHAAQRQVRLERLELRRGGQHVVRLRRDWRLRRARAAAAGRGRGSGTAAPPRRRAGRARGWSGIDRPAADRIALHVLALPGPPQVEDLVRPEVQLVAQRLAVGAGQLAGEGRRQPQAVRADAGGAARVSAAVSPTLIIQIVDLVRRAAGQHRVHRVGDEDQLAADRHLRPHRIGARRARSPPDRSRSRRRTAGCPDRRSIARPSSTRRRVGDGTRPRESPRRPRPAAGRCALDSWPCRRPSPAARRRTAKPTARHGQISRPTAHALAPPPPCQRRAIWQENPPAAKRAGPSSISGLT